VEREGAGSSESDSIPPPAPKHPATRTDVRERPRTPNRADPPPSGRGFGVALAYLNRRERTVAEVRARLERAEVPEDEIDAVITELLEFGYLDDARYARVFTQDKRTLEAWGNERIDRALRERGVERELIEMALAEAPEGDGFGVDGATVPEVDGELERAVALLRQRFPSGPAVQRDRERAFGVLARKGYESETAADAVREWARRTTV
jgi:regulatory protein